MDIFKCNSCFHKDACDAWIRHGTTLYDDFCYSVENCPYYASESNVKEIVHAKWEWFDAWQGDDTFGEWKMLRCSHCLESEGARENAKYCPNCGAIMDLID